MFLHVAILQILYHLPPSRNTILLLITFLQSLITSGLDFLIAFNNTFCLTLTDLLESEIYKKNTRNTRKTCAKYSFTRKTRANIYLNTFCKNRLSFYKEYLNVLSLLKTLFKGGARVLSFTKSF